MEVNRIDHSMQKILFSLAEQKTPQGDHLPNVYVIAAINHGDAYDLDIEISDIALKRRFAFIEFDPELENFRTEGLHPMVIETKNYMTSSRDIIDTNLKDADKVFEQATTYGSWVSYSDYLYQLEAEFAEETGVDDYKLSYEEAGNDVTTTAGPLFFKGETTQKIADIFFMLENTKSFDFEKIESIDDFYRKAVEKMDLPDYFGNNLDALWDSLTGGIELPMDIRFTNLNPEQLEQFYDVIVLFEDAAINLDDVIK